jgi:hypothetical protein
MGAPRSSHSLVYPSLPAFLDRPPRAPSCAGIPDEPTGQGVAGCARRCLDEVPFECRSRSGRLSIIARHAHKGANVGPLVQRHGCLVSPGRHSLSPLVTYRRGAMPSCCRAVVLPHPRCATPCGAVVGAVPRQACRTLRDIRGSSGIPSMPRLQLASCRGRTRGACCQASGRAVALDIRAAFLQPPRRILGDSPGPHTTALSNPCSPPPRIPQRPETPTTLPKLCPGSTGLGSLDSASTFSQESQASQAPPESLGLETGPWEDGLGFPSFPSFPSSPRKFGA